ncbi:MAG: winged helix-turn-helix domain-containing protein [Phycisphaerales bacterium JB065]
MVKFRDDSEAIEKIYKPHCRGLAATLEYLRDEWKEGDEKRREWMMKGFPTCGDTFMHFQRDWRYEIDRVLRKIERDRLPSTRPWLPDRYAERVMDLVAKMWPYKYDGDLPQRCMRTWDELGLDDELTAISGLLKAEALAVQIESKPEPAIEKTPNPTEQKPKKKKRLTGLERDRRIRQILRNNPGISQRAVARQIGCSASTIANSEPWKRRKATEAAGGDPEAVLDDLKTEQELHRDYGDQIYGDRPK